MSLTFCFGFYLPCLSFVRVSDCYPERRAYALVVFQLPFTFTKERYFTTRARRSPFVQQATPFQDIVIRCVRYAFARFPVKIGRVFFSKGVSLPFMRFRMLRYSYLSSSIPYREVDLGKARGIWIGANELQKPDVVIYYCHGGGFSMGSTYFYLEFLLAWLSLLKDAGYKKPAIFALEYTLVPDKVFPTQLQQCNAGYEYVLRVMEDSSRVCVAGDSAGATLILSLLLYNATLEGQDRRRPGYATLISPWPVLVSEKNRDTPSDYLNADSLHLYGRQYAVSEGNLEDALVSPGVCKDLDWWRSASPSKGFLVLFGSEEVLGPEIRELIAFLRKSRVSVSVREEPGGIHAWPVVTLFLSDTQGERQKGLRDLVKGVRNNIDVD